MELCREAKQYCSKKKIIPIVVSQNFSSATSPAKFAPINTKTSIFKILLMICEIKSIPPPSAWSNPWKFSRNDTNIWFHSYETDNKAYNLVPL